MQPLTEKLTYDWSLRPLRSDNGVERGRQRATEASACRFIAVNGFNLQHRGDSRASASIGRSPMSEHVHYQVIDRVAEITLTREPVNAIDMALSRGVNDALRPR